MLRLSSVADARVLVVDDEPVSTLLIRRLLENEGLASVLEINDPLLVESALPEFDPGVVLLDLRMPGMDGYDVLREIQAYAAGRFLPVVVLSSDNSTDAVQRALQMGAHDFLTKPFNAYELTLRVRNLLLHREAYQAIHRSRAWLQDRLDLFERVPRLVLDDPNSARALIEGVLAEDSLRIALQPIVRMDTGEVVGVEALSRFPKSPLGGPDGWFLAAERLGYAEPLEMAAVEKALRHLESLPPTAFMAVNVSPGVLNSGLHRRLGDDAEWSRIVVEVTEHVPIEDYAPILHAMEPLRARGARLSVDDAGAGFASLRHIIDLSPDVIKIDIGLIRGIDRDPSRAALVGMMVDFARQMGIDVIAEGVETQEEKSTLLDLGADLGQGYLLGRPVLVDEQGADHARASAE